MTQAVTDENGQVHYFPDDASSDEMNQALGSAQPQSAGDKALNFLPHQAGLLADNAIKGAAGLPELIGNIPAFYANQARHAIEGVAGIPQQTPDVAYAHPFSEGADIITGPNGQPQNMAERLEGDIVRPIAGVATGGAAAGDTAAGVQVPKALGQGMPMQYASAVSGGAGGGIARELGASPQGQLIAALMAGAAPSAATFGVNMGKQMLRGGDANIPAIQDTIDSFKAAGTSPSVGQATGGGFMQGVENLLGKLPGSTGIMSRFGAQQQQQLGDKAADIAASLDPNATPATAGRAIEFGIKESFLPSQQAIQGALYNKLDSYIPPDTQIPVPNTVGTVSKLAAPIPGMPALSNTPLIRNNAIGSVDKALESDMGGQPAQPSTILNSNGQPFVTPAVSPSNTMPYTALKQMRSGVGRQISDPSLIAEIPTSQLKQVYAATSQDMGAAAKNAGVDAENAANQADAFTKAFHDEADTLNPVINQSTPEQIYKSALSGSQSGGTKLGLVMSSLPTQARETVAAQALDDLGKATNSNQNAAGDVFSGNSFMMRWNQLSDPAKKALFGVDSVGPDNAAAIDNLANVTSKIKEGTKILANPSGSATSGAHIAAGAELIGSLLSGKLGDVATLGGGMGLTRLMGHLLANPEMVQGAANPKWSYMPNAIGAANAGMQTGN